jgi:UDP-N-acetyl-D-mannosaminuronic acid dehydrogenase
MVSNASRPSVCVLGTGYVGLPLCIMLAEHGHTVVGVDVQRRIVDALNSGTFPFEEDALSQAFESGTVRANFRASLTPVEADIFVIAVPTPVDHRKRVADLSYVEAAVRSLLPRLRRGNLVIIESTVPPLTCRDTVTPIIEETGLHVGEDVFLAHCPERILPGDIMREIMFNDRIIGGVTPESAQRARAMYASFVQGELLVTDDVTAEICKLMENTYRDINIALANELAAVCETLDVDVLGAISLANRHPRVNILAPGIGTGGHCIPVDPWFIREVDPINARMIETARLVNDEVPRRIAAKIRRAVASIERPRIVAIGTSYKPNTSDNRESPALEILDLLLADGYNVTSHDPISADGRWPEGGLLELARDADCIAVLVEHDVVRNELRDRRAEILNAMRSPLIIRFYQRDGQASVQDVTEVPQGA